MNHMRSSLDFLNLFGTSKESILILALLRLLRSIVVVVGLVVGSGSVQENTPQRKLLTAAEGGLVHELLDVGGGLRGDGDGNGGS